MDDVGVPPILGGLQVFLDVLSIQNAPFVQGISQHPIPSHRDKIVGTSVVE